MKTIFYLLFILFTGNLFAQTPPMNAPKVEGASFYAWLSKSVLDTSNRYDLVLLNKTTGPIDVEMWFPDEDRARVVEYITAKGASQERLKKGCYNLRLRRKGTTTWMELPVVNIK